MKTCAPTNNVEEPGDMIGIPITYEGAGKEQAGNRTYTTSSAKNHSGGNPSEDAISESLGGNDEWGATISKTKSTPHHSLPASSSIRPTQPFIPNLSPPQTPTIMAEIPIPPPPPTHTPPTPSEFREFHLTISQSTFNHEGYIERQGYYGGFNPDTSTMMAEDLEGRVPLEGMVDCQIRKEEVPSRIMARWREKAEQKKVTLRELWEEGKTERMENGGT